VNQPEYGESKLPKNAPAIDPAIVEADNAVKAKAQRTEISTRIIDTRKQIADTETEIANVRKQITAEVNNTNKPGYNNTMNSLSAKEIELQTKIDGLKNKLDVDIQEHAKLAPVPKKKEELNPEAEATVKETIAKIRAAQEKEITKKKTEGAPKTQERAEARA
jgi:predicted  nucleic acid-binding Zn-ribbon protein